MVNGADGVWSWNGNLAQDIQGPVSITGITKANPAVCTVAAGDIGKFSNGMVVTIAGASAPGFAACNGPHTIASVNSPANTFQLVGVDTSAAPAAMGAGATADPTRACSRNRSPRRPLKPGSTPAISRLSSAT